MPKRFLSDDDAKGALTDAIVAIEERCSAEIVVAVRARSHGYIHVPLIVGIVTAIAASAFMLFSHFEFSLTSIFLDPILVGAGVGLAATQLPPLARWLTPSAVRARWIEVAARATFFEKGIRHTRHRTGVLVYISLLERRAELVADSGVEKAVGPVKWEELSATIDRVVADGGDAYAVAKAMTAIGDLLEHALPRAEDDENELPDEVCA